jgi:hypothetical protein
MFIAALHFVLRRFGMSSSESKRVRVALRAQLVTMLRDDLQHVFPDDSSTCATSRSNSAAKLSSAAGKVYDAQTSSAKTATATTTMTMAAAAATTTTTTPIIPPPGPWRTALLQGAADLVSTVQKSLEACRASQVSMPSHLDLDRTTPSQFCDALLWEAPVNVPDAGEAVTLAAYVPIDFTQLPERATTCVSCP